MDVYERIKQIVESAEFTCPVCGTPLYMTDHRQDTLTFHCSSELAKFWNFENGTTALIQAKFHWDRSARDVFIEP